jgi:hypothetical protein
VALVWVLLHGRGQGYNRDWNTLEERCCDETDTFHGDVLLGGQCRSRCNLHFSCFQERRANCQGDAIVQRSGWSNFRKPYRTIIVSPIAGVDDFGYSYQNCALRLERAMGRSVTH